MSDVNRHSGEVDPALARAEETRDPASIARERFAHGMLQSYYAESEAALDRRVRTLLATIDEEIAARGAGSYSFAAHTAKRRPATRVWGLASGLAATLALVGVLWVALTPTGSALATVDAAILASKSAGDRRYTVKVVPHGDVKVPQEPKALVDVRDADHVVIQARSPWGDQVTVGRNAEGAWAIRPDGTVDRFPQRGVWPKWVNFGTSTVVLDSIDEMMAELKKSYTLKMGGSAELPDGGGGRYERVTATKAISGGPEPERFELWIDGRTHVVRRLEMHWAMMKRPEGDGGGMGKKGPPSGGRPGGPGGPGGRDGAGGPPWDRRGGPPGGRKGDGDGPRRPPGAEGPEGQLPPPDGEGRPPMREPNGPPPEGPGGREMGPPPGMRPGGPGAPEDRPEGGGRMGPGGERGGPKPMFVGERPDFQGGRHPPPPKMMVFELVEGATFDEAWFTAESHVKKE